jgi:hypothetical protein
MLMPRPLAIGNLSRYGRGGLQLAIDELRMTISVSDPDCLKKCRGLEPSQNRGSSHFYNQLMSGGVVDVEHLGRRMIYSDSPISFFDFFCFQQFGESAFRPKLTQMV